MTAASDRNAALHLLAGYVADETAELLEHIDTEGEVDIDDDGHGYVNVSIPCSTIDAVREALKNYRACQYEARKEGVIP